MALAITKDNFQAEVLDSEIPVLIDFWAPWCMPCRMIGPVIEELAEELSGTIKVAKLDVQEHDSLAIQYGVTNIPMFGLFKDGKMTASAVGLMDKEELKTKLGI